MEDKIIKANFFDTETTGTSSSDQIVQYGAIGTTDEMSIIDKHNVFCKLRNDVIPHPMATLTHKISIKTLREKGLHEIEFARLIESNMMRGSGICNLGYNTMKFDDQKIRELLFRNLRDPYAREWKNFNSRSDIFTLVRAVYVLAPSAIKWAINEDGKTSMRLEDIAKANGIEQLNAHDALSDVEATIGLAALIKDRCPSIYDHYMQLRRKEQAGFYCRNAKEPFLYIGKGAEFEHKYATVLLPVGNHASNKNSVICFDLRYHTDDLYGDKELVRKRMFERRNNPDLQRFPLMEVAINQSPAVWSLSSISDDVLDSIGLKRDILQDKALELITNRTGEGATKVRDYLGVAFNTPEKPVKENVYDGVYDRFYSNYERGVLEEFSMDNIHDWVRKAALVGADDIFQLTIRAVGNYDESLLPDNIPAQGKVISAKEIYNNWLVTRWSDKTGMYGLTVDAFHNEVARIRSEVSLSPNDEQLLAELEDHVNLMSHRYSADLTSSVNLLLVGTDVGVSTEVLDWNLPLKPTTEVKRDKTFNGFDVSPDF
ncbi:TPA: exodeoxyribonuclease I [Aeromonas veronii]